jgi:hypothetical protein
MDLYLINLIFLTCLQLTNRKDNVSKTIAYNISIKDEGINKRIWENISLITTMSANLEHFDFFLNVKLRFNKDV